MASSFAQYLEMPAGKPFAEKYREAQPREKVDCIVCGSFSARTWYSMGPFTARICRKCGTRFVSPRYDDGQLDAHYSEGLFTQSQDYEGVLHNMLDPKERTRKRNDMRIEIESVLKYYPKGATVLDIGCQTGIFLEALPERYQKHGIERSPWAANYCASVVKGEIRVGKAETADYPPGVFDVINMSYVVEHLQYPLETMTRILSWLRNEGILIVSVPNFSSLCSLVFREFYRLAEPRQHIYLTNRRSLKALLNKLNMSITEVHYPYWGTPYCNPRELRRLVGNAARRLLLPLSLKMGIVPTPGKVVSPPFWGNILTLVARKRNV